MIRTRRAGRRSSCRPPRPASAQTPAARSRPRPPQETPSQRLHRLFRDSDEASLRRNPLQAHVPRRLSLRRPARRLRHRRLLRRRDGRGRAGPGGARGDRPRRAQRRPTGSPMTSSNISGGTIFAISQPDLLALTAVRPINHFTGFHTFYPVFASGRSAAPFRNVEDYENNLTPAPRVRRGARPGRSPASARASPRAWSRPSSPSATSSSQLDTQLARRRPKQSPYTGPVQNFPDAVPEAERARLRDAHLADRSATASIPPTGGCAISSRTNICRTPATASASSTCAAATCSTAAWSSRTRRCR